MCVRVFTLFLLENSSMFIFKYMYADDMKLVNITHTYAHRDIER